ESGPRSPGSAGLDGGAKQSGGGVIVPLIAWRGSRIWYVAHSMPARAASYARAPCTASAPLVCAFIEIETTKATKAPSTTSRNRAAMNAKPPSPTPLPLARGAGGQGLVASPLPLGRGVGGEGPTLSFLPNLTDASMHAPANAST